MAFNFLGSPGYAGGMFGGRGFGGAQTNVFGELDPSAVALFAMADRLAQAGQPSPVKQSTFGALASSLLPAAQAYGATQRSNMASQYSRMQLEEIQRQKAQRDAQQAAVRGAVNDPGNQTFAGLPAGMRDLLTVADPATILDMQRRAGEQQRQQKATLSPDELQQIGLPPGTVAQRDGTGTIQIVARPDTMTQEAFNQQVELAKAKAKISADGQPSYGLTPIYGTDAQGNPVMLQTSNRGGVAQVQLPQGVTISKDPIKVDVGTHFLLLDPITRQQIGAIPKNNAAAAAQTAGGRVQGEAIAGAPGAVAAADQMVRTLDELDKHPGLGLGTGLTAWTSAIPGSPMADFEARRRQLQGQAFKQAFESLKGGGQITETEGKAATEALARLSTAVSEKDFRTALSDLRREIMILRGLAEKRMRTGQQLNIPGMPPDAPAYAAPRQSAGGWSIRPVQ